MTIEMLAVDALHRLQKLRRRVAKNEGGYSSETVAVTALLVACGLVVIGFITAAVIAKAHTISLG